jgi:endonuclease YncB( thermonuclease family)
MAGFLAALGTLGVLAAATVGVVALVESPEFDAALGEAMASTQAAAPAPNAAVVLRVIDGDTISTSRGTIRLIGIDAPELDTPCGPGAKKHLDGLVGATIEIRKDADTDNRDRYDRYLRYVVADGTDVGFQMVKDNWAVARYDGLDGYARHRNQSVYRAASSPVTCAAQQELQPESREPAKAPVPAPSAKPEPSTAPEPDHAPVQPADKYTGCRAYGSGGTSIDDKGRPYTKIDCATKLPIG